MYIQPYGSVSKEILQKRFFIFISTNSKNCLSIQWGCRCVKCTLMFSVMYLYLLFRVTMATLESRGPLVPRVTKDQR